MARIKPQAARERFAQHVRACETCDPRSGALCVAGELLARALAFAVTRPNGGRR